MLQIGKPALSRGSRSTTSLPDHRNSATHPVGPEIERSVVYSVARTESAFDQRDKSSANAVGLMQVTRKPARHRQAVRRQL